MFQKVPDKNLMVADKLSNMVACINRGSMQRQLSTLVPNNRLVRAVLTTLHRLGYIRGFVVLDVSKVRVFLKFSEDSPAIRSISRVSKPGSRVYVQYKK